MAHSLNSIEIAGFKSIREARVELGMLNVLIGANGSGKSNFIAAFGLLHEVMEGRLQAYTAKRGGADALLHFGQKQTTSMKLSLEFGPNGYEATLEAAAGDRLFFKEETCSYKSYGYSRPYYVPLGSGNTESNLPTEAKQQGASISKHVLDSIRSWKLYHFHDTSESARIKQKGDIDDNSYLRPDASNLAAFLYRLARTHEPAYKKIVATIRMVAPFFDDFVLRPDPVRPDRIQLEWQERGSDTYFNAHALSDGTLRFICLCTLFMQPVLPTTILLDEPELGLHPYAIYVLAGMMQSAATHTQVIVSTQSVTLLNQLSATDIIVAERSGQESVFRRIKEDEIAAWVDDYSLGELWEKNIIGGRP